MIIGVRDLTWGKFSTGGAGSAVTYSDGSAETDLMVRVDMNEEYDNGSFNADDKRIDYMNGIKSASVALELAKIPTAMLTGALGETATGTTTIQYDVTEADAPYVGVGFMTKNRYKGSSEFEAYWYYKVQFKRGSRSFNTKGDSIAFQTQSLEGEAMGVTLAEGGAVTFYSHEIFATEALALAWLKAKAGIQS